ncbi:MAG: alpha/beta hydrolase [Gammaproteobacteria bacterium]|jgi:pimeloyl-ACP methyl ester carboxylesterase|nr:alpha/beta hydrolase [Gammaproteobacteria bacterium]MCP4880109.1 alpha/beta hydrolase [Gammaproteobacteria bacterium]MDP6164703.1 alpha/beta hydrolase [Gammaproteobacteria bacterium]
MTQIPFEIYGRGATPLLFAHANGFPPGSYASLLQPLGHEYTVYAAALRPLWQSLDDFRGEYKDRQFWQRMAADQISFIEQHQLAPVTYVGHSMGSLVGLFAAHKRPDLFHQLIMIEPVFLKARYSRLMRHMPNTMKRRVPIVRKALGRPNRWSSMQAAFDFHRSKWVFRGLSDAVLWDYINAGVGPIEDPEGGVDEFGLLFDKHWEALVYSTIPNVWKTLKQIQVPIHLLRAEHSHTVDTDSWQRWQALPGPKQATEFAGAGHLLPLDEPELVADTLLAILGKKPIF